MAQDYEQQYKEIEDSYYFNRLKDITLLVPTENDDRAEGARQNRQTHTRDVVRISGKLAGRFGADAGLTKVISIAHDLAHMPYGHYGENISIKWASVETKHELNGEKLYKKIVGIDNWCIDVVQGIREHRFLDKPHSSRESLVVNYADEIASFVSNVRDGLYLRDCFDYDLFVKEARDYLGKDFPGYLGDLEDWLVGKADLDSPARLEEIIGLFSLGEKHWGRFGENWRVKAENINLEERFNNAIILVGIEYWKAQEFIDEYMLRQTEKTMKIFEEIEVARGFV